VISAGSAPRPGWGRISAGGHASLGLGEVGLQVSDDLLDADPQGVPGGQELLKLGQLASVSTRLELCRYTLQDPASDGAFSRAPI